VGQAGTTRIVNYQRRASVAALRPRPPGTERRGRAREGPLHGRCRALRDSGGDRREPVRRRRGSRRGRVTGLHPSRAGSLATGWQPCRAGVRGGDHLSRPPDAGGASVSKSESASPRAGLSVAWATRGTPPSPTCSSTPSTAPTPNDSREGQISPSDSPADSSSGTTASRRRRSPPGDHLRPDRISRYWRPSGLVTTRDPEGRLATEAAGPVPPQRAIAVCPLPPPTSRVASTRSLPEPREPETTTRSIDEIDPSTPGPENVAPGIADSTTSPCWGSPGP